MEKQKKNPNLFTKNFEFKGNYFSSTQNPFRGKFFFFLIYFQQNNPRPSRGGAKKPAIPQKFFVFFFFAYGGMPLSTPNFSH